MAEVPLAGGRTSPWTRLAVIEATAMPDDVVVAFRDVLEVLAGPAAPADPGAAFAEACRQGVARLSDRGAIQLASLVGAMFHELRHVHDFTASTTGAVFALRWARAAGDAEALVGVLARWTAADAARFVPTPVTAAWLDETFPGEAHGRQFTAVAEELERLRRMWTVERNGERILPGISISGLYEAGAYMVQMELTAALFGHGVATAVHEATDRPDVHPSLTRYAYALRVFSQLVGHGADVDQLGVLLGLVVDEVVPPEPRPDGRSPMPSIAGFFDARGPVPLLLDAIHDLRRRADAGNDIDGLAGPVVDALLVASGAPDWEQRYLGRRRQLDELLAESATSLAEPANAAHVPTTALLLAAEVPITYSELFRLRVTPGVDLFGAQEWAVRTLLGELAPATIRVRLPEGACEVVHSRSFTPTGPDLPLLADAIAARWKALTTRASLRDGDEVRQARQRMSAGLVDDGPRIRETAGDWGS